MPAPRSHALAVRLTPDERAAWGAAAARSVAGGTVAGWARAVVADVLSEPDDLSRPWALARLATVSPAEVAWVEEACAGLNIAARRSHVLGQVEPGVVAWVRAVADRAESVSMRAAAPLRSAAGVATEPRRAVSGRQSALITIWLSDAERDAWQVAAGVDGYERTSAWVRRLIGIRLGWEVPAPVVSRAPGLVEVHRQIGGAIANAAQMGDLATDCRDVAAVEVIVVAAERITTAHLALGRAAR